METPKNISGEDLEINNFNTISQDDWTGLVEKGIPLYKKLKATNNPKAEEIRRSLSYALSVIQSSGSGSDETRNQLIDKIKDGIIY